jgi:hypothetical protein
MYHFEFQHKKYGNWVTWHSESLPNLNAALDVYFSYNECGTIPDYEERIIGTFPTQKKQPFPTYHQITSKDNIFHFQYLEEGKDNWVTWSSVYADSLDEVLQTWQLNSYVVSATIPLDHQRIIGSVPFRVSEKVADYTDWRRMPTYVQIV